jgi:hypothetical protein
MANFNNCDNCGVLFIGKKCPRCNSVVLSTYDKLDAMIDLFEKSLRKTDNKISTSDKMIITKRWVNVHNTLMTFEVELNDKKRYYTIDIDLFNFLIKNPQIINHDTGVNWNI